MGLTVIKRDGREEPVAFDKITARINKLAYGLNQDHCDPVRRSFSRISQMPPDSKKPALSPGSRAPSCAARRTGTHKSNGIDLTGTLAEGAPWSPGYDPRTRR